MVGAIGLLLAGGVFADYWTAIPADVQATYVGRSQCIDCHKDQADAFAGSHHDLAMDLATEATVLGDFNDATLEHDGMVDRMFRDGDRFMVHTEGETGQMEDFEVKYVFGYEPLQQYMVEFDRAPDLAENEIPRLQVLRICWDTEKKRWFYLRPPDVDDKLEPDDPLHWTGIAQRWQTMCADCHSTNLKRNFDVKTARYHTTFSEIDVSCEACHGPGSMHVDLANSKSLFWDRNHGFGLAKLKGEDAEPQLQTCAPCHSRRGMLDANFRPGPNYCDHFSLELLNAETYHDDGQIKDEVYVYGSFVQSRMYHKGIRCSDCHDPHSLKLKHPGNETCTSCHQHAAGKYDVPSHHHHKPGTPGAMCVNCHMPETTYMAVDPRRDHSLRIPRPDLSTQLNTPNACSGCHVNDHIKDLNPSDQQSLGEYADWLVARDQNQSIDDIVKKVDQWCDEACQQWYGEKRRKDPHFAETLHAFRAGEPKSLEQMLRLVRKTDDLAPPIARATALSELARTGRIEAIGTARKMLADENQHPIVRAAAINVFLTAAQASPDALRDVGRTLLKHIDDPVRLVRSEAVRVLVTSGAYGELSGTDQLRVDKAIDEVRDALMTASDRSGAHMGWAMLCEARGLADEAEEAYRTAIRIEPKTTGARTNLAQLLEQVARSAGPQKAKQLADEAKQLRKDELPLLRRDASLAPDNADLQYRFGLSLYLADELDEARQKIERAIELAPENNDFRQALKLLDEEIARRKTLGDRDKE